jgi:hypothetical protein
MWVPFNRAVPSKVFTLAITSTSAYFLLNLKFIFDFRYPVKVNDLSLIAVLRRALPITEIEAFIHLKLT